MHLLASIRRSPQFLVALVIVAIAGCGDDSNPTAPIDETTDWTSFAASHDTYIDSADDSGNFGQDSVLAVGSGKNAFLQFDLGALHEDAVIEDMRLRLTQTADRSAAAAASVAVTWTSDDGWEEDAATAADPPNMGSQSLGSISLESLASGRRDVVFTSPVAREKTGQEQLYINRILSIRLSSSQSVEFYSSEAPDDAVRPGLDVTYADGTRLVLTAIADATTNANNAEINYDPADRVTVDRSGYRTFLKFDLSSVPDGAQIEMARFKMLASHGYAWGGDGNVYSRFVADDSWDPLAITANNEPEADDDHCGYWWLWYNYSASDKLGTNNSQLLRPVVQAEADGDQTLSLRLNSPGYTTYYYRIRDEDPDKRPVLELVYTR